MLFATNQLGYSERDAKNSKDIIFLIFMNRPTVCKPCSLLCNDRCKGTPCTKLTKRQARCVCDPDCSNAYKGKVCSTNQKTYSNECALLREKCSSTTKQINVDYYSRCKASCKNVRCPTDKFCVEDQYRVPHCITNAICKKKCKVDASRDKMLCGTNGVTYQNRCFLRKAICHLGNGKSVGIAYKGKCKKSVTCRDIKCPKHTKCLSDSIGVRCVRCKNFCMGGFHLRQLVCGSNGVTYRNWCSLRNAACKSGRNIEVIRNGSC
eukprot:gene9806-10811_t